MPYENILYSVKEKKAVIVFNRPKLHNALNFKMIEEIQAALKQAADDRAVRVIILQGAGKSFCAGDDFLSMRAEREKLVSSEAPLKAIKGWLATKGYEQLVLAIRRTPKPVIASVKGHALGAGCDIMLACDFRVVSESANMGLVYTKIAFAAGILTILYHVGLAKATEILFTGNTFTASEAQEMGLVNVLTTDEKLEEDTFKLAEQFTGMPTASIGLIKQGLNNIINLEALVEEQLDMYCKNYLTADVKEGGRAFAEKRKPEYKGY